jgi:hypothetical protein
MTSAPPSPPRLSGTGVSVDAANYTFEKKEQGLVGLFSL